MRVKGDLIVKRERKPRYRWYDHILLNIVLPVCALLLRIIFLTCRLTKIEGKEMEEAALEKSGGRAVYPVWHQRGTYHTHILKSRRLTVMVSQSRDGEYASRLLNLLGARTLRGSSTRGGLSALYQATKMIKAGINSGMVVDGPKGPPRVAKLGAVILARNAQVPIIPVAWGVDRCWILNTWDRLIIPKPFSRTTYRYMEPIWVPRSAKGEELEKYRKLFEDRLNEATTWCDIQLGPEKPWRLPGEGLSEIGPAQGIKFDSEIV